jgi:hypothetical protein
MEFTYHGELVSEAGLEPVAQGLSDCSWRIGLRRSGHDGSLYLRSLDPGEIDLEMDSGQSSRFVFSGSVSGSLDRAMRLLSELSQGLTSRGCVHRIEVYDEADERVGYLHHAWPGEVGCSS